MSVREAQEEFDFVVDFENRCKRLIEAVQQWEALFLNELKRKQEHHEGGGFSIKVLEDIEGCRKVYEQERDELHSRLVRFRELSKRYTVMCDETWLTLIPTGRFPAYNPDFRDCTFTPYLANAILKEIRAIRGAALHHLEEERKKAARPWYVKRGENIKSIAKWVDANGYTKYLILAVLIITVAAFLHHFGYDPKSIIEIVKLVGS